jgi:hypothetical protein
VRCLIPRQWEKNITLLYDQGDVIYAGCLADLDKALEYFNKTQEAGSYPLSAGDTWNGGDVNKWIKLCYGLKARFLNQISKKSTYDPAAVLAALNQAPQSNADNTIMKHYNVVGDAKNFTVADPYQANTTWDAVGYGTGQRATRWYVNLLTNKFYRRLKCCGSKDVKTFTCYDVQY